ncbi:DUF4850 domain-containing protein [Paenibacillus dokdonensis]|uniref:DUF4850 domain-containing protein n=1 Tax=Paenibacillus dokdonensis TaxID=2567944 RepID=UPI0010A7D28E|nr:DUF4850 domain-containing protein [Paenibacillus dokdonensis]
MKRIGFWKQGSQKSKRYVLVVAAIVTLLFTTSLSNPKALLAEQQHETGQQNQTTAPPASGKPSDSDPDISKSRQPAVQCGVLKLKQSTEVSIRQIPLYCISGKFYGEEVPTNLPHKELPVLQDLPIPPSELTRWGAYFLNESSSHGYLMLAPRNWEVTTAETGMNGSAKIEMRDPSNPDIHLTYLDVGPCQGCAIGMIGSYFPQMEKWAEEKGFMADPPVFESRKQLNEHMVQYKLKKHSEVFKTYGMAYRFVEQNNNQFTLLEIETPEEKAQLAQTMLNFFSRYPAAFVY